MGKPRASVNLCLELVTLVVTGVMIKNVLCLQTAAVFEQSKLCPDDMNFTQSSLLRTMDDSRRARLDWNNQNSMDRQLVYVSGIDANLTGNASSVILGSGSKLKVWYDANFPEAAQLALKIALHIWADLFKSTIPVRIKASWGVMQGTELGETIPGVFVPGNMSATGKLDVDTIYLPTIAEAIEGSILIPCDLAHIVVRFRNDVNWNLNAQAAASMYETDFVTVALHEMCHGLFFTGLIDGSPSTLTASVSTGISKPARFDRFVSTVDGQGLLTACPLLNGSALYTALTNVNGVRYIDSMLNGTTNFTLFAPSTYAPGSSVYHFDSRNLALDCALAGIAIENCSDLMTPLLPPGYTQRSVGENTMRVMRSQLGQGTGGDRGKCQAGSVGQTRTVIPLWGIAALAVACGVALIVGTTVLVLCLRRPS